MSSLTLDHASCVYPGGATPSVAEVSLAVRTGEFLVLLGAQGAGKSTLLRLIAGLEETSAGSILIDHRDVTRLPPKHRDVAMVFQNYALYPQMSVSENMAFALKVAGVSREERTQRVALIAQGLDLADQLDASPADLTGRQRQRVAVGRALARIPSVLLLDEPFTGLARAERRELVGRIRRLTDTLGITTVYATRELPELDDPIERVAVIAHGRLRQADSLEHLRSDPADLDVARTVAGQPMACWTMTPDDDGTLHLDDQRRRVGGQPAAVVVGVPERQLHLADGAEGLPAIVEHTERHDDGTQSLMLRITDRDRSECTVRVDSVGYEPGDRVFIAIDLDELAVFDSATGIQLALPLRTPGAQPA
ncbi:ABC transporter ATP-binding protein [Pseudoclavibacter soli]|uniref:ABC transporter ATP-binding protein n=1 Tax=Pseudoclavibacter soli TaxID=452623 RepID=UPI000409AF8F|nr:ABC transporter ATP-binding protein [Pseudoclavibacter soli]